MGAMATDSELVQQTQKGNPQAFTALVERHFGMVYAIAYAQMGHRETAEDLTQEVFLRAYLYLASLENPACFLQWLVRITHNLAKNWHRSNARGSRLVTMVPIDDAEMEAAMAEESRASEAMAMDENAAWLNEAILKLPEEQREGRAASLHGGPEPERNSRPPRRPSLNHWSPSEASPQRIAAFPRAAAQNHRPRAQAPQIHRHPHSGYSWSGSGHVRRSPNSLSPQPAAEQPGSQASRFQRLPRRVHSPDS